MARLTHESVSVWSLDSEDLLGELENITISSNITDEDGSAINEVNEDPIAVARARTISGTAQVATEALLLQLIESGDPYVAFVLTTGGNSYSGNALLTAASHELRRKSLQRVQFTLKVKGSMTTTAPGDGGGGGGGA